MTDLMPLCLSLGVGTPANEPSPRNTVPSSVRCSCAASLIVKGRTRTGGVSIYVYVVAPRLDSKVRCSGYLPATVIDEAPGSGIDMLVGSRVHQF